MRPRFSWLAAALLPAAFDAGAATVLVTNLSDAASTCPSASACTLRGAIAFAAADDRIEFAPSLVFPATIQLAGSELAINKNLTVVGPGADRLEVRAASARRIAAITSGNVTIERIALAEGRASTPNGSSAPFGSGGSGMSAQVAEGGCIRTSTGTSLLLRQVALRDCEARGGHGGAGGSGSDGITPGNGGSGGSGGRGNGGAISSFGQLTFIESSVHSSFARGGNGGAGGAGGEGTLGGEGDGGDGGASGLGRGGAIYVGSGGALLVRNSTFGRNGASSGSGGKGGDGGDGAAPGEGAGGNGGASGDAIGGQVYLSASLTLADTEFSSLGPALVAVGPGGLRGEGSPAGQFGTTGTGRPEIYFSDSMSHIRSSFFLGADAAADCEGIMQGSGNNADSDSTCAGFNLHGTFAAAIRTPDVDVLGGRAVLLPRAGSLVVDGAANCNDIFNNPVPADQNGRARPVDGNSDGTAVCDIGAVEFDPRLFGNGFE